MSHAPSERSAYQYSSLDYGRTRTPLSVVGTCLFLVIAAGILAFVVFKQRTALAGLNGQMDQATAETARAKSDLAKVAASESDLRLQLVKAESGRAEIEAEAAKARGTDSELQSELAQAQGARSELQVQLDRAKAELQSEQSQMDGLRGRLAQAEERSSGQSRELAQSNGQADALKEQLARSQEVMTKPAAPAPAPHPLPLTASFRTEFWSSKFKLRAKNQGAEPLDVEITVTDSAGTSSKSATIKAGKTFELGKLKAGAGVTIASEGFDPVRLVVRK